jgi:hypothetical protein
MMDPDFNFVDETRTQEATVVDVLAHRMGVPDHTYLRLSQNLTRAKLVKYSHNWPFYDILSRL